MNGFILTIIVVLAAWLLIKKWDTIEEIVKDIKGVIAIAFLIALCYFVVKGIQYVLSNWMGVGSVFSWIIASIIFITTCVCLHKHNG